MAGFSHRATTRSGCSPNFASQIRPRSDDNRIEAVTFPAE